MEIRKYKYVLHKYSFDHLSCLSNKQTNKKNQTNKQINKSEVNNAEYIMQREYKNR